MIIEVESYFGDTLLSGKVRSIGQLKYRVLQTLADTPAEDFISVFCARYQYEPLPYSVTMDADYRIDLDTCQVFKKWRKHK